MKLKDYIIIGVLFLIALGAFVWVTFFNANQGDIALVYYRSDVYATIDFSDDSYELVEQEVGYPRIETNTTESLVFVLLGDYEIDNKRTEIFIEVDFVNDQVRIQKDATPLQIGVNRGWYNGQGLPVVSLPNQVFIRFVAEQEDSGVDGSV